MASDRQPNSRGVAGMWSDRQLKAKKADEQFTAEGHWVHLDLFNLYRVIRSSGCQLLNTYRLLYLTSGGSEQQRSLFADFIYYTCYHIYVSLFSHLISFWLFCFFSLLVLYSFSFLYFYSPIFRYVSALTVWYLFLFSCLRCFIYLIWFFFPALTWLVFGSSHIHSGTGMQYCGYVAHWRGTELSTKYTRADGTKKPRPK